VYGVKLSLNEKIIVLPNRPAKPDVAALATHFIVNDFETIEFPCPRFRYHSESHWGAIQVERGFQLLDRL
jgi:hypothetical protein